MEKGGEGDEKEDRFRGEIEVFYHPASHHHAERAEKDDDDAHVKGGVGRSKLELGFEKFGHEGGEDGKDEALRGLIERNANVRAVGGKRPKIVVNWTQHAREERRRRLICDIFLLLPLVDKGGFFRLTRLFVLLLLNLFPTGKFRGKGK